MMKTKKRLFGILFGLMLMLGIFELATATTAKADTVQKYRIIEEWEHISGEWRPETVADEISLPYVISASSLLLGYKVTNVVDKESGNVITVSGTDISLNEVGDGVIEVYYSDAQYVVFKFHVTKNISATGEGYTGSYDPSDTTGHGISVSVSIPDSGYEIKYGTSNGTYNLTESPKFTTAGNHTVYYQITADGYNTKTGSASVNIGKADNPITYNASKTVTKTFSIDAQTETLAAATGGVGDVTYTISSQKDSSDEDVNYFDLDSTGTTLTIAASTPAGTYTVKTKATAAGNGNYNERYKESTVTVTVNRASSTPATITANNRTYDGTEKPLVNVDESKLAGGKMWYALGADATTAPEFDGTSESTDKKWSITIPAKTNAGTYYVWYKVIGDENHDDSRPVCITVTISNYIPAPTITIPVEDGSATTKTNVTVSVSGSTVNVNTITEKNLNKAAEANGTVIIDASGLKKDIKEVKLNDTTVKNIKESDAKEVEIALTDGSIVLDEKTIETVEVASTSDPLVVHLDAIPVSTLNTSQQEALAGVDTSIILKVTITRGKTEIHDLNGGKVKIKAKCQVASGKAPDVYYLTPEGVLERVSPVDYDGDFVSWMTDHCSEYVVKEISAEADAVTTLIETLGDDPTVEDVRDARKAYEALGDKKSEVDGSLVNILKAAEDNAAVSKAAEASVAALDYEDREAVKSAVSVLEETLEKGTFEEIIKAVEELEKLVEDAKAEDKELVEKAKAAVKAAVDNPTDATVKAAQDALAKITTDPQKALYGEEYQTALSDVEKAKKTVEDNKKAAEQKAAEEKAAKEKADREKVAKEKAAKELAAAKTAARTALKAAQAFSSYPAVKSAVTALNAAVARNDTAAIKTATVTLNKAVAAAKAKPVAKKAIKVKIKTKSKTYKASRLEKKAVTFKIKYYKTKGSGKVSFKKTGGSPKLTVSKAGKVKIKKGIKKGTYKIKVKISVAANKRFKAKSAKKTIKVRIKD